MILNEFELGQWICLFIFFLIFLIFFTLKVFVSLKIEKIYTTDKRNEKQKSLEKS